MYHSSRKQFLHAKFVACFPARFWCCFWWFSCIFCAYVLHSYHFVLSKSVCKTPNQIERVSSLVYECDELCTWSSILDVHMFAEDSFNWFASHDSFIIPTHVFIPLCSLLQSHMLSTTSCSCCDSVRPCVLLAMPPTSYELCWPCLWNLSVV